MRKFSILFAVFFVVFVMTKVNCLTYEVVEIVSSDEYTDDAVNKIKYAYEPGFDTLVTFETRETETPGGAEVLVKSYSPPKNYLTGDETSTVLLMRELDADPSDIYIFMDYDYESQILSCVHFYINETYLSVFSIFLNGSLSNIGERKLHPFIGYVDAGSCITTDIRVSNSTNNLYISFFSAAGFPHSGCHFVFDDGRIVDGGFIVGYSYDTDEVFATNQTEETSLFVYNSEPHIFIKPNRVIRMTSNLSTIQKNWTLSHPDEHEPYSFGTFKNVMVRCVDEVYPLLCLRFPTKDESSGDKFIVSVFWENGKTFSTTVSQEVDSNSNIHFGDTKFPSVGFIPSSETEDSVIILSASVDFFSRNSLIKMKGDFYASTDIFLGEDEVLPKLLDTSQSRSNTKIQISPTGITELTTYYFRREDYDFVLSSLHYSVCPRGLTYSNASVPVGNCESCVDGYTTKPGAPSCVRCDTGKYANTTTFSEDCYSCPPGTFTKGAIIFPDQCRKCPPGQYSSQTARGTDCDRCPEGFYGTKEGQTSQASCVPCKSGKICKSGWSYPLDSDVPGRTTAFSVDFYDFDRENEAGVRFSPKEFYTYSTFWKLLISGLVVLLSICFFQLPFSCVCCPKKFFCVDNCCKFQAMDYFYSLKHDIEVKKGPVKIPTCHGGFFSVAAISLALILIGVSIVDLFMDGRDRTSSMRLYTDQNYEDFLGNFKISVLVFGSFPDCSNDCSASLNWDGVANFFSESSVSVHNVAGCECRWSCQECDLSQLMGSDNNYVQFDWDFNSRFVNYILYNISVPHYDPDMSFIATGTISEVQSSIQNIVVRSSVLKTKIRKYSYWNYITSIIGVDVVSEKSGMATTIKSSSKTVGTPVNSGYTRFIFEMSDNMTLDEEKLKQGIMNFIAQIFALFGFSVAFVGCFYECCDSNICCGFRILEKVLCDPKKNNKVADASQENGLEENKDEEGDNGKVSSKDSSDSKEEDNSDDSDPGEYQKIDSSSIAKQMKDDQEKLKVEVDEESEEEDEDEEESEDEEEVVPNEEKESVEGSTDSTDSSDQ